MYELLKSSDHDEAELYHLSTNMCARNRQEELEEMLEDFLDEDYAELYSVRETEMRKTILAKVRGWRGEKND